MPMMNNLDYLVLDGEPRQNHEGKRAEKPRAGVYKVV
jgi:hypothetical protein